MRTLTSREIALLSTGTGILTIGTILSGWYKFFGISPYAALLIGIALYGWFGYMYVKKVKIERKTELEKSAQVDLWGETRTNLIDKDA